jgi:hypothetical protein
MWCLVAVGSRLSSVSCLVAVELGEDGPFSEDVTWLLHCTTCMVYFTTVSCDMNTGKYAWHCGSLFLDSIMIPKRKSLPSQVQGIQHNITFDSYSPSPSSQLYVGSQDLHCMTKISAHKE